MVLSVFEARVLYNMPRNLIPIIRATIPKAQNASISSPLHLIRAVQGFEAPISIVGNPMWNPQGGIPSPRAAAM